MVQIGGAGNLLGFAYILVLQNYEARRQYEFWLLLVVVFKIIILC